MKAHSDIHVTLVLLILSIIPEKSPVTSCTNVTGIYNLYSKQYKVLSAQHRSRTLPIRNKMKIHSNLAFLKLYAEMTG